MGDLTIQAQGNLKLDSPMVEVTGQTTGILPPGTIIAYAGNITTNDGTPPAKIEIMPGWLLCNGAELERNEYKNLFEAINYAHGGSGSKFRLPDCRGYFLRGVDRGAGRDPDSNSRTKLDPS